MATLQIEHAISDLTRWQAAFGRFADARTRGGVRSERIRRPAHDDHYIVIDLEFDTVVEAEQFRQFLHEVVWAAPENSPALVGTPRTRVLQAVVSGQPQSQHADRRVDGPALQRAGGGGGGGAGR